MRLKAAALLVFAAAIAFAQLGEKALVKWQGMLISKQPPADCTSNNKRAC
jgi:hypothetical protein